MKICTKCKEAKPFDQFGPQKRGKDGLRPTCRPCDNAYNREWCLRHPRRYSATARRTRLKRLYGITQDQYDEMLSAQGKRCSICSSADPLDRNGVFHVDHDHLTGRVRGLLCSMCNKGLGSFRDDVRIMQEAISYIHRAEELGDNLTAEQQVL